MKISYSRHLKLRLRIRRIPKNYPQEIYQKAKLRYIDTLTGHKIAVLKLYYAGKIREMTIVYDIISKKVEVITIYPQDNKEREKKIKTGRWRKDDKN